MRRIFVGDIQGCRQQLQSIVDAVGFDPGADVLYPVGDLVNKGPDSEGVLRLLRDLDAKPVLGNHDLRWLATSRIGDPELQGWLESQPCARVLEDLIVVHAGLHPDWSEDDLLDLSAEQVQFAVTVRYCDAAGNRPESDWPPPKHPFLPWYEFYSGSKMVLYGHWARQGLVRTERVLGLDTGCVYGRQLTAWIAEEDRIVQVAGWNRKHR